MKKTFSSLLMLAAVVSAFSLIIIGCKKQDAAATQSAASLDTVVVWAYDSFISEWGPGEEIARRFTEKTGKAIQWESHEDAGALLARVLIEGKAAGADVILGLDQNMEHRALAGGLFEAYTPNGAERILPELRAGNLTLVPFDYSYFAICYDSEKINTPPASLEDLCKSEYARKIILMDPRSSSPGLGMLAWTISAYGDAWGDYWRRLSPSVLTTAGGWSSGYGLFTSGEAPLVLSYTTSPGYHLEYENSERYRAAIFPDGHPIQIELAGLLASAPHKENAKLFLDFMLSNDFQELMPLGNWMYPVTDAALPDSVRVNTKPAKTIWPRPVTDAELDQWAALK
jgi:thiamine transport system substrate-binding protein